MIRDIQSRICISLNKDDAKYSAGDVIKGAVVIDFPQEITVKGKCANVLTLRKLIIRSICVNGLEMVTGQVLFH